MFSKKSIYNILSIEGFPSLPWRSKLAKQQLVKVQVETEKSIPLQFTLETFKSFKAGMLMFLVFIRRYGIDTVIACSDYSQRSVIDKNCSIMCFFCLEAGHPPKGQAAAGAFLQPNCRWVGTRQGGMCQKQSADVKSV